MTRKWISLSKDQEEEVCQLYDHLSIREIGQRFNVSFQNISKILKRNNIPRRQSGNPFWSRGEYYQNPWASFKTKKRL